MMEIKKTKINDQTQIKPPQKNLELKKPSELCQVLFYSDFNKNEYAVLTPLQIDLASTMFFFISDVMNKQQLTKTEIFEWASLNHFEINLQTIADMLGKYDNGYYEPIVNNLQELTKVQVLTNTLHKNKTQETTLFHLIRKISWLKEKQTTNKRVKVWIEPELLIMFHNVNKLYTQFYLQIQYGLNSKYSKLLYELLKDYVSLGELVIDFEILKAMINVDVSEDSNHNDWSAFNRDILKRAIKEVTDKSDISVTYEPIKERIDKKIYVSKVKFKMSKQKSILIDYDAINTKTFEMDTHIVLDEVISEKDLTPLDMKYIELAQKKVEDAKLFGMKIMNVQAYLEKIIENLKKENIDVLSMIEIDDFIITIKNGFESLKTSKNQLIVLNGYEKYPFITISKDYLLYSPADTLNITKTIKETINKLQTFKKNGGQFKLIETPMKISDFLGSSYL